MTLIEEARVASVPGPSFYASGRGDRLLRFCFAKDFGGAGRGVPAAGFVGVRRALATAQDVRRRRLHRRCRRHRYA